MEEARKKAMRALYAEIHLYRSRLIGLPAKHLRWAQQCSSRASDGADSWVWSKTLARSVYGWEGRMLANMLMRKRKPDQTWDAFHKRRYKDAWAKYMENKGRPIVWHILKAIFRKGVKVARIQRERWNPTGSGEECVQGMFRDERCSN